MSIDSLGISHHRSLGPAWLFVVGNEHCRGRDTRADIKFFRTDFVSIKGSKVHALWHGRSGQPGLEVWGPVSMFPSAVYPPFSR